MLNLLTPSLYRKWIHPLVSNRFTYLFGMFLLRSARKARVKANSLGSNSIEQVVIQNYAGSIRMQVDKNSYMGGSIYWSGYHHLNECLFLDSILKQNMTFVDVGANQGEFTLFAAQRLVNGKVIAFEPVETNLKALKTNVSLNNFSNVVVEPFGLFNEEKKLPVYTSFDQELNGGRHEGLSTIYPDQYRSEIEETISLKVFDDLYFNQLERFDFLKIDIEGAELYALQGMKESLKKFHPIILIEISTETVKNAGYSADELVQFLIELGYHPHSLFRGKLIKEKNLAISSWGNFVFIPQ